MSDVGFDAKGDRKRILVQNERLKLAANSLDRMSTACVAAGFIATVVSLTSSGSLSNLTPKIGVSTIVWLSAAFVLHLIARQLLGKLEI